MVTRALRIAAVAIGVVLGWSSVASAQSRPGGFVLLTGGATVGGGTARVETDTSFTASGPSRAVQLGADLTGNASKPYLTVGGGLSWTMGHLVVEASYRYGRILPRTSTIANDTAINTHRVQG